MKKLLIMAAVSAAYPQPRPIFDMMLEIKPRLMNRKNLDQANKHFQALKKDPNRVFGDSTQGNFHNTRTGEIPGFEINMHDDEPVVLGEVNMDSSDSGSDYEETAEDREYLKEAMKAMDSRV